MTDNIAATAKQQDERRRDFFRSGLSDRSRTMSLGALVLIWGVFTEKSGEGIKLTPDLKRALFVVAIGAVLVLMLDFVEYVAGYFSTFPPHPGRLRIERVLNRSVCESSRSVCLGSKIFVAVVLCLRCASRLCQAFGLKTTTMLGNLRAPGALQNTHALR